MKGFKRGFYTTSKKLERKPESNLGQSSFPQPSPLSQSQEPEEEQKQAQKTTHEITPTSQEKLRKQMKFASVLRQEVSEFDPFSEMSMEQLIKVVLNLQEEVRKLKKDNDKLMENMKKQEEIESRLMSQERDLKCLWIISQSQNSLSQKQDLKYREIDGKLAQLIESQQTLQKQIELRDQKQDKMEIEEIKVGKPLSKREVKFCYYCGLREHL